MANKVIDLVGNKYGRLTVRKRYLNDDNGRSQWTCACACRSIVNVKSTILRQGITRSCGCLARENCAIVGLLKNRTTHGMSKTNIYSRWCDMLKRCYNTNSEPYVNYGGRGITVCKRWHKFENFFKDMGNAPYGLTIERVNNDGNYEKGNCRWANRKVQNSNTRRNVFIRGELLEDIKSRLGFANSSSIMRRIKRGWTVQEATTIVKGGKRETS